MGIGLWQEGSWESTSLNGVAGSPFLVKACANEWVGWSREFSGHLFCQAFLNNLSNYPFLALPCQFAALESTERNSKPRHVICENSVPFLLDQGSLLTERTERSRFGALRPANLVNNCLRLFFRNTCDFGFGPSVLRGGVFGRVTAMEVWLTT